jgi:hypothetical protein
LGLTKIRLKNHLLANFVLSQPLRDFNLCPSLAYSDCEILLEGATMEHSGWSL